MVVLRAAVYGADGAVLSRPPPIQKLGAENHMLQLNIQFSWWWAYVPETRRAKNTLIKLPCSIKLAFQVTSYEVQSHVFSILLHLNKDNVYTVFLT